jgi:hypothetical protein
MATLKMKKQVYTVGSIAKIQADVRTGGGRGEGKVRKGGGGGGSTLVGLDWFTVYCMRGGIRPSRQSDKCPNLDFLQFGALLRLKLQHCHKV